MNYSWEIAMWHIEKRMQEIWDDAETNWADANAEERIMAAVGQLANDGMQLESDLMKRIEQGLEPPGSWEAFYKSKMEFKRAVALKNEDESINFHGLQSQ